MVTITGKGGPIYPPKKCELAMDTGGSTPKPMLELNERYLLQVGQATPLGDDATVDG